MLLLPSMQRFSRLLVPEKQIAACSLLGARKFQALWQMFKSQIFPRNSPFAFALPVYNSVDAGNKTFGLTENELKQILNPRPVLCLELGDILTSFHFEIVVDDLVWFFLLLLKGKKS